MSQLNLLKAIDPSEIEEIPFPHVVLKDVLDKSLADELARSFPDMETFTLGESYPPNSKIFRKHQSLLQDDSISRLWRQFTKEHCRSFLHYEIDRLLGGIIRKRYPNFERKFGKLSELALGYRGAANEGDYAIVVDVEAAIHTPSPDEYTIEREAHCKGGNKIAELHYFLRDERDKEGDCECILYGIKDRHCPRFGARNQTSEEGLAVVKRVPYQSNTGILFLNTPETITKISARRSKYPFQYLILVFQMNEEVFSVLSQNE